MITHKDRDIIRGVAQRQLELANSDRNKQLKKDWLAHNTFRGEVPMIHLELETFAEEIAGPLLRCEGEEARKLERKLYMNFLNQELFYDDWVVPDTFNIHWDFRFSPLGIDDKVQRASGGGVGHHFVEQIQDLEQDFHLIKPAVYTLDKEKTLQRLNEVNELIGGIIPVVIEGRTLYACLTQKIVHIMGMETMLFSMYDYTELFHKMMRSITDDFIGAFRFMEREGILMPTAGGQWLGQGSLCFTDELPDKGPVCSKDVWGFLDSQETVGISPEMFCEFIFPYYKELAGEYGLLSYGCCEPVHGIWDSCLSPLENLRKVSISPWCDETFMGQRLKGRKTIYHRKPSPNYLGVDRYLDEDAWRGHIRTTLKAAKGCGLEFTLRDIYTVHGDVSKAKRGVAIIREEIENYWQ